MDEVTTDCGALAEAVVFLNYFKDMPDPRQRGKVMYPLREVLLLALLAVLTGAESFVDIARFGCMKRDLLRRFRPFLDGTPSHDHLGDIFAALDAEQFQRCFVAWTASLIGVPEGMVAIDGKTARRSGGKAGKGAIHMVSAFVASQRLVLGRVKVAEKSTRSSRSLSCSTCWWSRARSSRSTRWDANARSPKKSSIRRPITSLD
jgi:hypothetical protein